MLPVMPPRLPAEAAATARPDLGFILSPDNAHLNSSGAALRMLAAEVNAATMALGDEGERRHLTVRLSHADHHGLLAPLLYGFHLTGVEGNEPTDDVGRGVVRYVLLLNQPVGVQVQTALLFLAQLVARQQHVERVLRHEEPATSLDQMVVELDEMAQSDIRDELRFGWQAAARAVARQAGDAGIRLLVEYAPAAVSTWEEWAVRLPALRRVYNQVPAARDAVDRVVAAVAAGELVAVGHDVVPTVVERFTQRTANMQVHRYTAHALRDALVTGAGCLALTQMEPVGVYAIRPDELDLLPDGRARRRSSVLMDEESPVLFTAITQPGSLYGLGMLEVLLPSLRQFAILHAHGS
jgi:hypothetical protein